MICGDQSVHEAMTAVLSQGKFCTVIVVVEYHCALFLEAECIIVLFLNFVFV